MFRNIKIVLFKKSFSLICIKTIIISITHIISLILIYNIFMLQHIQIKMERRETLGSVSLLVFVLYYIFKFLIVTIKRK